VQLNHSKSGPAEHRPIGLKLHIGAFDCALDGWHNTDITPHIFIGRVPLLPLLLHKAGFISRERYEQHRSGVFRKLHYLDLCKPLPFANASFEAIFSSHVLEHLFLDEVVILIAEFRRVMIPGGICRVVVPDLDKIVATYDSANPTCFLESIYEISKRGAIKNAHHSGFSGAFLARLFRENGFSSTRVLSYRVGECPDIDKLDNRPDSLFFEAMK